MGSMNPNLLQLVNLISLASSGGVDFRDCLSKDDGLRKYVEQIKLLNMIDFGNPEKWPWNGQQDGYSKTLRRLIGHYPVVAPVATAVVLDENRRMLLERRSDNGKWTIPSGMIEPGESVRESVARELEEETGLIARSEDMHLFDEVSGDKHVYPSGDVIYSVKLVYIIKRYRGELHMNFESTQLDWFCLYEVPHTSSGSTKKIAEMISNRAAEVDAML